MSKTLYPEVFNNYGKGKPYRNERETEMFDVFEVRYPKLICD